MRTNIQTIMIVAILAAVTAASETRHPRRAAKMDGIEFLDDLEISWSGWSLELSASEMLDVRLELVVAHGGERVSLEPIDLVVTDEPTTISPEWPNPTSPIAGSPIVVSGFAYVSTAEGSRHDPRAVPTRLILLDRPNESWAQRDITVLLPNGLEREGEAIASAEPGVYLDEAP